MWKSWVDLAQDFQFLDFGNLVQFDPILLKNQKLIDLAIRYNKNVVQIFFAYLNHIGITPLTGTTDLEHMQIDLESFDINLEKDDVLKLDSLF